MINRKVIYIFLFLILIGFTSCGGTNNNLTTNELPTSSEETTALTTAEFETTRDNPSTQEITTEIPTDIEETTTSISTTIDQTTTVPTTTKNQTTETTTIHYVIITFDNMEGASGTTSMEGIAGNSFSMPDNPTRSGFVFDGWFLEDTFETPFNISEYPQNNMTVYAKWTKLISIYFETLNGSSNTPILIGVIGDLFQLPDNPIRFGYVFDGWYLNQTFTTPFTMTVFPDNDITV